MTETAPDTNLPDLATIRSYRKKARTIEFLVHLNHSPRTVIRYLGQVDMVNRLAGNPRVAYTFIKQKIGGTLNRGEAKKTGMTMVYTELPYEWVFPYWSLAELFVSRGPVRYVAVEYYLKASGEHTEMTGRVRYVPRGLGIISRLFALKSTANFKKAVTILNERAVASDVLGIEPFTDSAAVNNVDQKRLADEWKFLHSDEKLTSRMAEFIATAPEKLAGKIRPLALAAQYGFAEKDVIEFFLRATRAGYFNLSWDLLCPNCRGDKATASSLSGIKPQAHCDYCDIDYGADFDKNVELTFRPVERVRRVNYGSYCVNSPGNTKHIFSQINIWSDDSPEYEYVFPEARYRLESPQISGKCQIEIDDARGSDRAEIRAGDSLEIFPLVLKKSARIKFLNSGEGRVTVKFIAEGYRDYALTAARVTAMQEFRNQFGSEALSPGLELGIENLAILFTDLKDSTPLYENMGDAPAFALVRDHFDLLMKVIDEHNGAVVKTIGDAVMAVFIDPVQAFSAGTEILRVIRRWPRDVTVKIGVHLGACIAVTLNDKLDYFGTTVNRAARIQGQALGDDIVASKETAERCGFVCPADFEQTEFTGTLKGIAGEARLVRYRLK